MILQPYSFSLHMLLFTAKPFKTTPVNKVNSNKEPGPIAGNQVPCKFSRKNILYTANMSATELLVRCILIIDLCNDLIVALCPDVIQAGLELIQGDLSADILASESLCLLIQICTL